VTDTPDFVIPNGFQFGGDGTVNIRVESTSVSSLHDNIVGFEGGGHGGSIAVTHDGDRSGGWVTYLIIWSLAECIDVSKGERSGDTSLGTRVQLLSEPVSIFVVCNTISITLEIFALNGVGSANKRKKENSFLQHLSLVINLLDL
jgi:hypothetical protein